MLRDTHQASGEPGPTRLDQLSRRGLFRDVPKEALADLAKRLQSRTHAAETFLVSQDDAGEALYVIVSGHARVCILSENGRELTLARLGPGDFFGEMALLDGSPRSANVIALDEVTLLVITRTAFTEHLQRFPQTALQLLGELSRRLRRADEAIADMVMEDVEARLVRALERLARAEGEKTNDGLLLRHRPTQQELASMVGACRETVSRTFASLLAQGLLVRRGRSLLVTRRLLEASGVLATL